MINHLTPFWGEQIDGQTIQRSSQPNANRLQVGLFVGPKPQKVAVAIFLVVVADILPLGIGEAALKHASEAADFAGPFDIDPHLGIASDRYDGQFAGMSQVKSQTIGLHADDVRLTELADFIGNLAGPNPNIAGQDIAQGGMIDDKLLGLSFSEKLAGAGLFCFRKLFVKLIDRVDAFLQRNSP